MGADVLERDRKRKQCEVGLMKDQISTQNIVAGVLKRFVLNSTLEENMEINLCHTKNSGKNVTLLIV